MQRATAMLQQPQSSSLQAAPNMSLTQHSAWKTALLLMTLVVGPVKVVAPVQLGRTPLPRGFPQVVCTRTQVLAWLLAGLSSDLVSCTVVVLLPVLVVVASNVYCLQAGWRGGWKGSPVSEAQHAAQKATLSKACMCVHTTCVIGQHEPRKASSRPSRPHMHFPASPSKAVWQHLAPKCCHRATEWRCFSRNCKCTVVC